MKKPSESMIYVGFDIGKSEHAWAAVNEVGFVIDQGVIRNTKKERLALSKKIIKSFPVFIVGMEATGSYYETMALTFLEAKKTARIINPALTSTKALRTSMRCTKTDKADAIGIAKKLAERRGEIGTPFVWNPEERRLQALGRHIRFLKRHRSALRVRIESLSDRPFRSLKLESKLFDEELKSLERILITEALLVFPKAMEILTAIRGLGEGTAAALLAEAGSLSRFTSSRAFAAFPGLDPTVKQSGTSVRAPGRLSKAGSPHLRHMLGWSAKLLVQWNSTFPTSFQNSLAKGKVPGVAYGMIARKLATIIYQCVTKGEAFMPEKVGLGILSTDQSS